MKDKLIIFFVTAFYILTFSVFAQEKKEQPEPKIELIQLNCEQKLDRTVMNLTAFIVGGIAYAKSVGQTADDFGKFMGKIIAPSWEGSKGKNMAGFVENLHKNFQSDENCQWQILDESEKMVKVKMKRFGDATVKTFSRTGVTPQEYDRCVGWIIASITEYLGFYYNQGTQEDTIIFWVSTEKEMLQK